MRQVATLGLSDFLGQAKSEWTPAPGDRTLGAWIAILLYMIATGLCWRAHRRARLASAPDLPGKAQGAGEAARGWLWVGGCMLLLGVTRLLDLGNLITAIGRRFAHLQGWYGQRRVAQVALILALGLLSLGAGAWILERARHHPAPLRVAYVATLFVLFFVVVRACSWHYLDLVLGIEWKGFRVSWLLESGSVCWVVGSAARVQPPGRSSA